jgi:7-cyano-7-deazaguanine synthase
MLRSADALVLLSGGLDSTACLHFVRTLKPDVAALFVDYGQRSVRHELDSAQRVTKWYGVPLHRHRIDRLLVEESGGVPARNGLLVLLAANLIGCRDCLIFLGIHRGTPFSDCTPAFVALTQQLLDLHSDGRVRLAAPFLNWTKADIWDYIASEAVPHNLTYSCELGSDQPCGKCNSCADLLAIHGTAAKQ